MKQEVQAITRYVRCSPLKVQHVVRIIRGLPVQKALDTLKYVPRKSARLVEKTLKSAIANAENNHNLSSNSLVVASAIVGSGPVLKRWRPSARGQAHPFRKRTSHIQIILTPKD
jgi:large subunit ribosomal protein L22